MTTTTPAPGGLVAELRSATRVERGGFGVQAATLHLCGGATMVLLGARTADLAIVLELLAGLRRPSLGEASIGGIPAFEARRTDPSPVGVLPLRDAHFEGMSGFHNAYFLGALAGLSREQLLPLVDGLFDELGMRELRDLPVRVFSSGQRRRLSLLQLLLRSPSLLLLHSPLGQQPPGEQALVLSALERRVARGMALGVATSDPGEAAMFTGQVAMVGRAGILGVNTGEEWVRTLQGRNSGSISGGDLALAYAEVTGLSLGRD